MIKLITYILELNDDLMQQILVNSVYKFKRRKKQQKQTNRRKNKIIIKSITSHGGEHLRIGQVPISEMWSGTLLFSLIILKNRFFVSWIIHFFRSLFDESRMLCASETNRKRESLCMPRKSSQYWLNYQRIVSCRAISYFQSIIYIRSKQKCVTEK